MAWPPVEVWPPQQHFAEGRPEPSRLEESISLDEGDFEEVYDIPIEVDCSGLAAAAHDQPEPDLDLVATREAPSAEPVDPACLYYVVSAGREPGELVLRALAPDEPPPFGVPIAKIVPSCGLDAYSISRLLGIA